MYYCNKNYKSVDGKERIERQFLILNAMTKTNSKTTEDFSAVFYEVCEETIRRDIRALSKYFPIAAKQGHNGGLFTDKNWDFGYRFLTDEETEFLSELGDRLPPDQQNLVHTIISKRSLSGRWNLEEVKVDTLNGFGRRVLILDILNRRRSITMTELAQEMQVCTRTIRRDISELAMLFPIETACGNNGGVYVSDDEWTLFDNELSKNEENFLVTILPSLAPDEQNVMFKILRKFSRNF